MGSTGMSLRLLTLSALKRDSISILISSLCSVMLVSPYISLITCRMALTQGLDTLLNIIDLFASFSILDTKAMIERLYSCW